MRILEFNKVFEKYRIKFIKEGKVTWEEIFALEDISFKVDKGEVLGIIGQNGAGKTTLLKLIAGMLIPDQGNIDIKGKVSALMELGAGFNLEFTGRENITLNARMYGLNEETLDEQIAKIIDFAGLGKFIDAPIKYYSQGMFMRLAFALAIYVDPDILLIDDILAVGDEEARQKCIKKICELKEADKTIILITHDMGMISRLCDRVILLEKGKIIQEGLPVKVVPYYLETVGDKKGIAMLEREKLRIIFNNGRLTFNYDGIPITKTMGCYASFFDLSINAWFSSFNLSWQMKSISADKIIAEGRTCDGFLSQIWILRLEGERLHWQVEIKEEEIKEPRIDLFFSSQYTKGVTLEKEQDFPTFVHKSNWQDLEINSFPDLLLGIAGPEVQNPKPPSVILKIEEKDNHIKIFNSGYDQEARIIQAHLRNNFISMEISAFSHSEEFKNYINNAREKFLVQQQAEQERLHLQQKAEAENTRLQRTISYGDLRLFADADTKSIRVFFKEKEITGGDGLHSLFNFAQKWYHSKDARWQIQKISEREMTIIFNYEELLLSQIFNLICDRENNLRIKIEFIINEPIFLTNQGIRIDILDKYKNWWTLHEEGDFSVGQYINNISPIRLKNSKISKILLKPGDKDCLPPLYLEATPDSHKRIFSMFKRKQKEANYISLNFFSIIPGKAILINSGRYTFFEGKIILGKDIELEEESLEKIISLERDDLKIIFDQGSGRIFWRQNELTTGLGIYSSVCSSGIWYDSYQASWEIISNKFNKIVASGDWPYIPISQVWQIELIDKNSILLIVDMEIYKEVILEIEQTNIMLSPKYKNWIIPGENKGKFLEEYPKDYDILPFRFWYGKSVKSEVSVIDTRLPNICFKNNSKDDSFRAIVENSDFLYQGRLIQYQKTNSNKLMPIRYRYFEGIVKIEPKE